MIADPPPFCTSRSDDDTFFPDFEATVRMLAEQGSSATPSLVGALSESTKQVSAVKLAALTPTHPVSLTGRSVGSYLLRWSRYICQPCSHGSDERSRAR